MKNSEIIAAVLIAGASGTALAVDACNDGHITPSSMTTRSLSAMRGVTDVDPIALVRVSPEFIVSPYVADMGCGRRLVFINESAKKEANRFASALFVCEGNIDPKKEGYGGMLLYRGDEYATKSRFGDIEKDAKPLPAEAYQADKSVGAWQVLRTAVCQMKVGEMPKRLGG